MLVVRGKNYTVKWKVMAQFPIKKGVGDVDSPLLTPRKVVSTELLFAKLFSNLFHLLGILFTTLKPQTLSTKVINVNLGCMPHSQKKRKRKKMGEMVFSTNGAK